MSVCSRCAAPLTSGDWAGHCGRCREREQRSAERRAHLVRRAEHLLNFLRWPRLMLRVRRAGRR